MNDWQNYWYIMTKNKQKTIKLWISIYFCRDKNFILVSTYVCLLLVIKNVKRHCGSQKIFFNRFTEMLEIVRYFESESFNEVRAWLQTRLFS